METVCLKAAATREQEEIIKRYLDGASVEKLINEYSATHIIRSEKTGKNITMPKEIAGEKICAALSLINWA